MVAVSKYPVPNTMHQVPGTRYKISGTRYRVPCAWYQQPTKYQVPCIWHVVPGTRRLALENRSPVLQACNMPKIYTPEGTLSQVTFHSSEQKARFKPLIQLGHEEYNAPCWPWPLRGLWGTAEHFAIQCVDEAS